MALAYAPITTRTRTAPDMLNTQRMTLTDLHRIKALLALGVIERVVVPGASPRIRYRAVQATNPTR